MALAERHVFQARIAERNERFPRDERTRSERLAASCASAEALHNLCRAEHDPGRLEQAHYDGELTAAAGNHDRASASSMGCIDPHTAIDAFLHTAALHLQTGDMPLEARSAVEGEVQGGEGNARTGDVCA
ncbi:hypothetical protein QQM39_00515 [Streptomyces sp. DT2A-34]|uniref:hypothetical protein n=1 Tax=Streptomyces sp. DT2A-34 TaxID=3051182 RepID=UPI00265B7D55|nr:hypothetical protein [Streptomyces sp. DT2A-34]MDO0909397.1 hypothetical protein [Streptomyces sp. DT2A-34]